MNNDFLLEQIKTIRNLCDVAIFLRQEKGIECEKGSLLATILELLYEEAQSLTDEHCVVKE